MSKRTEFTRALGRLLVYADEQGLDVLIDWAMRSTQDQMRLFNEGKSKCDGISKRSKHQMGLAADIYIIVGGKIDDTKDDYDMLHDKWDELGGGERISWDACHYEWR